MEDRTVLLVLGKTIKKYQIVKEKKEEIILRNLDFNENEVSIVLISNLSDSVKNNNWIVVGDDRWKVYF